MAAFEVLRFLANLLGITIGTVADLAGSYLRLVIRTLLAAMLVVLACAALIGIGHQTDTGALVGLGTLGIAWTGVVVLVVGSLIGIAFEKAADISPITKKYFQRVYALAIGGTFFAGYIWMTEAHRTPLFWSVIAIAGLYMLTQMLPFENDRANIFKLRINIALLVLSACLIPLHVLPTFAQLRLGQQARNLTGLAPQKVRFTDIADFFTDSGQPLIWYGEYEGRREFFTGPRNHPLSNDPLSPITPKVIAEEREKLQKEHQRQEKQTQLEAEQTHRAVERQREVEKDGQHETKKQQVSQPITIPVATVMPWEVSELVNGANLVPFQYAGRVFPERSVIRFALVDARESESGDEIDLRPTEIITPPPDKERLLIPAQNTETITLRAKDVKLGEIGPETRNVTVPYGRNTPLGWVQLENGQPIQITLRPSP